MSVSNRKYKEIKKYVEDNMDTITVDKNVAFFTYETTGLSIAGVCYGYYFSENNDVLIPDYYTDDNMGEKKAEENGTYFGTPNSGTDWCFVKQIRDGWFYYELHWG